VWCRKTHARLQHDGTGMKNLSASVRARLLNIARREKRDYNRLLLLYLQERLLARLALSKHQKQFVLKGGVYLYSRYGSLARPTMDLDLLGQGLKPDLTLLADIMRDIAATPLEDGVRFDPDSVVAARIKEGAEYEGVRVKLTAYMDSARITMQVDIGFGDSVIPQPQPFDYPTLLELPVPAPTILAYAIETVVAEKFHAMVTLGASNSRTKDFYDIYQISRQESLEAKVLREAIFATFKRRESSLEQAEEFLNQPPVDSSVLLQGWEKLRVANPTLKAPEKFEDVVGEIRAFLEPLIRQDTAGQWQPDIKRWVA
jgi:predicted nucleotidyltransferase component of viral defense system